MFTENNTKNDLIIQDEILVENQLIYMNWYRYIKLKIKQDYIHGERAITHYLISTDNKTLVILNGNWFGTICAYLFWLLSRRERSGVMQKRFSESFQRSEPLAEGRSQPMP